MLAGPAARYPNPTDPLNGEAAALMLRDPRLYDTKVREYVKRYASSSGAGDDDAAKKRPGEAAAAAAAATDNSDALSDIVISEAEDEEEIF